MAITQQNIINQIPCYIGFEKADTIGVLKSLVRVGWSNNEPLFNLLQDLEDLCIQAQGSRYVFHRENLSYTLIKCNNCLDMGSIFDFTQKPRLEKPCPNCTANSGVN